MIEGCIVAKLVLGYLREEGLYRTCSAFQDECSLFHDNNKELDNVFLTADLKTILVDYNQLKESGNGVPSSTAVLKSLWNDLDIVIGQLKYATIPSSTSNASMESQSTRTRRLNHGRSRRSIMPKTKESITTGTTSNASTTQLPSRPNGSNETEKLPLQKPSSTTLSPKMLSSSHKNTTIDLQPASASSIAQSVQSTADKEPVSVHSTSSTVQSAGPAVAFSSPCMADDSQAARTSINAMPTVPSVGISCDSHTSKELSRNADVEEGMFDGVDEGDVCNDQECDHRGTADTSPPVIVVDDERSEEQRVLTVEEHSLSHSHHNQDELQLRSPKRKGIQPKKRVPQGATGTSAVIDSPVKLVPESAEVEMDITCSSDTLTPHSFLGTLLSTPLLQEKLAENINKIVGSSRQQPVSDEPPSATVHSLTTTEASSDDTLTALNQGAGGDIPVKEIMDLMQTDPAFDVLFSFFGLDALDALPSAGSSAADSTCTVLPETSAESNQLDNSTTYVSSSGVHLPDVLGSSSSLEECRSDSGAEMTTMLPTASHQQVETSSSSSTSDLHLSATSIVTDALLLLAGSPQKMPSQTQTQLDHSACVLPSVQRSLATPPKKTHSVERHSTNDKQTGVDSLCNQPSLITSTFPYIRALDFNLDQGPEPAKRGRRKGSKNKKGAKQKTTKTDEQRKTTLTKKGTKSSKRHVATSTSTSSTASSSSSDTTVGYRNVHVQSVPPSTAATNIYTGIGQPLANFSSAFNRTSNPIPSSVAPVACSNTSSYNVVNCGTLPTPISVCSPAIRPSPGIPVPSPVTYINPASSPTSSLLTLVNPINGPSSSPVNFTGTVMSQSHSPVNHASLGSNPVLINHNNLSTCPTPPAVIFATSGTHACSPLILNNAGSVCSPSPVSVSTQYLSGAPSVVSFMNQIECATSSSVNPANTGIGHHSLPASFAHSNRTSISSATPSHPITCATYSSGNHGNTGIGCNSLPASLAHSNLTSISSVMPSHPITCATSSSVNLANAGTGHNSLSTSFACSNLTAMSSATSLHQVVNTVPPSPLTGLTQAVIPGHFTDSSVTSATTSVTNSLTGPEQSVESGVISATSNTTDAGVTQSRSQVSRSPISLQASNLLQTLALQHTNTETNELQNITSGLEVIQPRKESGQGMQRFLPRSELALGHQPLKEKSSSKKNTILSKDSTAVAVEKRKDSIPLVCESSSADVFEKGLRNTVPVAGQLPNSLEDKNGGTSTFAIMNQECCELLKENSTAFLQSGTSSESEGQGSSKPRGKRRRDSLQKEKEKKTKSSSRPSKRSKTKAESINFPSDLNVEEFLSKLQYEVK